jgi:uncharacterized protein with GYD domain
MMVTYVALVNWTDQGIKTVKDTAKRAEDVRKLVERMGGRMVVLYWTQGRYDLVGIFEGPDEETANAMFLAIGMNGAVRTETLRAFTAEEVQRMVDKLP